MLLLHWNETELAEESQALREIEPHTGALLIGTDFSRPAQTIAAMVEARRLGRTIALYPMLSDPLEAVVEQVAAAIATQNAAQQYVQLCALRENMLQVNHKPFAQAAAYDTEVLRAAFVAIRLADVLLFFTAAEKERWSAMLQRRLGRFAFLPVPNVHRPPAENARGVAIYAPQKLQQQLGFVALALAQHHIAATVVSAENPNAAIAGDTVIVPAAWRPARAAAFAAAGYRVIASNLGAPDERCACATYRREDVFSLGAAVDAAQSGAPGGLRYSIDSAQTAAAIESERAPTPSGPRVSFIVRTYDRPHLLKRALRSIAAQTYGDVEIVVVNNGGEDVEHLVSEHSGGRPFRYVVLPERKHISAASNAGAHACTGTYVGYLDDDDLLYPDHAARAVDALERSAADVAYTNCLAEYAAMHGEHKELIGFSIFRDGDFIAKQLLTDNVAPIHSIVHRRDVFDRFGYFNEEFAVQDDWEMWLRASRSARFIHVDRVTCEYSWRHDPKRGNMTLTHQREFAETYVKITSRYAHDAEGIPGVQAMQGQIRHALAERANALESAGERQGELLLNMMTQGTVASDVPLDPFARDESKT